MLRMTQSKSAGQAKSYYVGALSREEYYTEGQELAGTWHGKGAEFLGLQGDVGSNEFHDLCDNRDPATGTRLTARTKSDRSVGYDMNFHAPKSLSVLHAHTQDERIVTALRGAVGETMREIETDMQTRVRMGGAQEKRLTGNMVWGEFVHMTARPVGGKSDPHLHAHCFVFNATHDPIENRWKAGHFGDLKRDACYYEAAFHSRLAERVRDLGYGIEAKGKFWEVENVPQTVIDKFSQRRDQIEALAEELGISDAAEKDQLGAKCREKKVKLSMDELRSEWSSRMTQDEKAALDGVRDAAQVNKVKDREVYVGRHAIDHAIGHVFERASVVSEKDVLESALRFGVGRLSVDEIKAAFASDDRLVGKVIDGEKRCTTRAIWGEERDIIAFAKETKGVLDPIKATPHEFADKRLNDGQRRAVEHVLSSRDQVTVIRGRAGTGKTTLMAEAVQTIHDAGYGVVTMAPTAESSRGTLREAGFKSADTVESFLQSPIKQEQAAGKVIWVDEAGLLSARTMRQLFDVAKQRGCRLVLVGDTDQHSSVERGDALRTLEKHAGLKVPEVSVIVRQREAGYRSAVEAMSRGDVGKAFSRLEEIGAFVVDSDIGKLHDRLANDYVTLLKTGKDALIIAPQHQEGAAVTEKVRERLRQEGRLKETDSSVLRLNNLGLTDAERADNRHYRAGQVVQFVQNVPGFKRGERFAVVGCEGEGVTIQNVAGEKKQLPLKFSSRFQLYGCDKIELATGDKIRVTNNSYARTGQRLNNGTLHTVARVHQNGEIELKNNAVLAAGFGHLTHGYYVTSHTSQSKTVDWALLAQSSKSFNAGSREQMNVSLSRGRDGIRIYTDDKAELKKTASRSSERGSATDLLGPEKTSSKSAEKRDVIMSDMNRWWKTWNERREKSEVKERWVEANLNKERGVAKGRKRGFEMEISL